jgi:AcrR family transcriptional regulator
LANTKRAGAAPRRSAPRPAPKRPYDASLRQAHAEDTAARILDAVHARLGKGDRTLSYAAIAREAKVSVPTVYRHFPTQDDLFRAYAARTSRGHDEVETFDRAALLRATRAFFGRFDDPKDPLGAVERLGTVWQFSRVGTVPRRRALAEKLIGDEAPDLPEPQRTWMVDAVVVLFSSATGEAFRGYLGLTGAEMADRVDFITDALLARAQELSRAARRTKKEEK